MDKQTPKRRGKRDTPVAKSHLTGKLFDASGEAMSPVFTYGRGGKLYRYYVSASLQQGGKVQDGGVLRRISATDLEVALGEVITRWLPTNPTPLQMINAAHLREGTVLLDLPAFCARDVASHLLPEEAIIDSGKDSLRMMVLLQLPFRGGKRTIEAGTEAPARHDKALIAALRKAHRMLDWAKGRPSIEASPTSPYERQILRLALLAPQLQADILAGRQTPGFNLELPKKVDVPIS